MPRPQKCRKVCRLPGASEFAPIGCKNRKNPIILAVDEYEAIRLIDKEGFSQEQCSKYMNVARTTVQQIYTSARQKIAASLVDGLPLKIQGGAYQLCDGSEEFCGCGGCQKHKNIIRNSKGDTIMKIAATYENGNIFQHFGHTQQFKIYETADGQIINSTVVDTNGSGHGALAGFLAANGVNVLICGGIGGGAQMALAEAGIKLYGGVQGPADEAVAALLLGELDYNPDVRCSHHDHQHGEGQHSCGNHGCGSHSCGSH